MRNDSVSALQKVVEQQRLQLERQESEIASLTGSVEKTINISRLFLVYNYLIRLEINEKLRTETEAAVSANQALQKARSFSSTRLTFFLQELTDKQEMQRKLDAATLKVATLEKSIVDMSGSWKQEVANLQAKLECSVQENGTREKECKKLK